MTLNGVMAVILRYYTECVRFRAFVGSGDDMSGSGSGADEMFGQVPFHDRSSRTNHAVSCNISYLQRLLVTFIQIALFAYTC